MLNNKMSEKSTITKKVINTPESCVDDNLRGIVATYPSLHLHPKNRVITVRRKIDSGRVAVIGGGGSGHEPFACGLVGPGMLDGAVAGGVFASPPAGHILYGIAQLYKYNSGGVMVIFGNYTGDRLNFGKAVETAKIAGIKVEGLIVAEDVASSMNKTGGRSMCGEAYIYKLCAALAKKGYDLMKIKEIALAANQNMATLGISSTPCSLPGQPPLFAIACDEIEVGAGVHGEAGIYKMKMGTAKEIVTMILDKVVAHLKLTAGNPVAVMINNLGATSFLEMNIIAAETKDYLDAKKIKAKRIFCGHMKTSLEMQGFQICLLHLNQQYGDLWLECLDAETSVQGWAGSSMNIGSGEHGDDETLLQKHTRKLTTGPRQTLKEQELIKGSLTSAAEEVIKNENLLNKLDSGCGDGDCGITLKKFALAVQSYLKTASTEYPSNVLWDLSEITENEMGGSSGGVYSLGLSAASQVIASGKTIKASLWLTALEDAMKSITKYGGAEPGDRTMLDTLHFTKEALRQHLDSDTKTILQRMSESSEIGAKSTAEMSAKAGRASYVASEYLQDEDAGARGVAIWMQAIAKYIAKTYH